MIIVQIRLGVPFDGEGRRETGEGFVRVSAALVVFNFLSSVHKDLFYSLNLASTLHTHTPYIHIHIFFILYEIFSNRKIYK